MEDLQLRHRNRLRHHYTMTSNVLLFGYKKLSDGAKLTYQVVDSFDWEDDGGVRKGYAYPSIARVASARGVNERTIQRHLAELEDAALLEREVRVGMPNLLIINEPSEKEAGEYLASLRKGEGDKNVTPAGDKNVTHKQDKREEYKPVNEEDSEYRAGKPERLGSILGRRLVQRQTDEIDVEQEKVKFLAELMREVLADSHSEPYFRKVARIYPSQVIMETIGIVKELAADGKVRKNRAALFAHVLKSRKPAVELTLADDDPSSGTSAKRHP